MKLRSNRCRSNHLENICWPNSFYIPFNGVIGFNLTVYERQSSFACIATLNVLLKSLIERNLRAFLGL